MPNIVLIWLFLLVLMFLVILFILFFYKFNLYDIYQGSIIKNDEENYLYLLVDEDFSDSKNRNYLIINKKEYKCHLKEFDDDYYLVDNHKYWNAKYECDLPNEINVHNSRVKVSVYKRKTTLGNELWLKVKEAIKNARIKN